VLNASLRKVIRSLDFQQDNRAELFAIHESEWPSLLQLTDRAHITLPLGIRCRDYLPQPVRDRIDGNLANNILRQNRLLDEYRMIAGVLLGQQIDFVVLKGLSHIAPYYADELSHRPQYDIDLYCPPNYLEAARDSMTRAGFLPIRAQRRRTDHLPSMMRDTNWKWRGDYYDPDLPLTVELHFRFWDPATERLTVQCIENFWRRRTSVIIRGMEVPVLDMADGVSYAALHLVRHLLRGDVRVYHAYELARFLHYTANDEKFWRDWLDGRAMPAYRLEAVAFRLAAQWFGCRFHPIVGQAVNSLPLKVARWFDLFGDSPLELEKPNKDELFLHLCLLENATDRFSILTRRLFPVRAPKLVDPSSPDDRRTIVSICRAALRQTLFALRRALHHLRTTVPLIRSLFRWKTASRRYVIS